MYQIISTIILGIPISSAKTATALPPVIALAVQPFSHPSLVEPCLLDIFKHVLPIPLLPNRLPLASLTALSAKLPFQSLHIIETPFLLFLESQSLTLTDQAHLLSNLVTFVSPRFPKLPEPPRRAYLHFCTALINALPPGSLEAPATVAGSSGIVADAAGSDSEGDEPVTRGISVRVMESFSAPPPPKPPTLDVRTYKRLTTLFTPASLSTVIHSSTADATRRALYSYLVAILSTCGSSIRKESTITGILVTAGPGLIRELWRGYVRRSSLGKDTSITQPESRSMLPPTMLLCDLYAQSLLTMGDDEFFGRSDAYGSGGMRTLGDSGPGKLPSAPSASS